MKVWRQNVVLLGLALATPVVSQPLPEAVWPIRDDAGLLSEEVTKTVRAQIEELETETTAEVGVFILATTGRRDAADYAQSVFNHWEIGKAESDNGVLLLFAMDDRRVELVPGIAYEGLFTQRRTEQLLQGVVVPLMRAGQSERAVAAMVEEVAREIRIHEGFEAAAPKGVSEKGAGPATPRATSELARPESSPLDYRRQQLIFGTVGLLLFMAWIGGLGFLLFSALRGGRLLVPRWALWSLIALGLVLMAGIGLFLGLWGLQLGPWIAGGGLVASLGLAGMARHLCPRCHRWCSIRTRTLRPATSTSSGTGKRTTHCAHCGYHDVKIYTISQQSESSPSSSRGGSSGSRRSFGGGSSRGGGGGASW